MMTMAIRSGVLIFLQYLVCAVQSLILLLHFHYSLQVKVPILAMRGGTNLQTYVDILVPSNAKLTLIKVYS